MSIQDLKTKKIAVVGLGVNNGRMADYFRSHGVNFDVITDWKNPDDLVGKLDKYEIIFRTPGLPYLSKAVQQAKDKGVIISSQTKLFFELCPAQAIGVTGTKGKGTTASLIAKIFEAAGKKTFLAGNIGRDPFEFLDELRKENFVVMELSSFQLQDLDESPHAAVVLSIGSDHLNHHKDLQEYIAAKSSIISHQKDEDFAILSPDLPDWFTKLGAGRKVFFEATDFINWQRKLHGLHNLENIAAAASCAEVFGIDEAVAKKAVSEFEALPHRLKLIRTAKDVDYIDDGYSTNVEPVMAAIAAMKKPTILIIGGFDKGVDFSPLQYSFEAKNLKGLVIIGQVTEKIRDVAKGFRGKILTGATDMSEIISQANSLSQAGDVVLFSPGTSSFDMFKNETDRAEQFVNAVNKL